jgi:GDPmannose 4,6-dehydratase
MTNRRVLITGINGMDGSHMADYLLAKGGYDVYGMERLTTSKERSNTKHLEGKIEFLIGDLTDQSSLTRCLKIAKPDEVYNFAAQSIGGESWRTPELTGNVTGLGVLRLLNAIKELDMPTKFWQASTSDLFGLSDCSRPNEETKFRPSNPYGVAKLFAHEITRNYRESDGMFNVTGIMFTHESERRGIQFVTRKISSGVAKIKLGKADKLSLGALDSKRDWGYAPDYVKVIWKSMQKDVATDYVIGTGKAHSVKEFLVGAFNCIGISEWEKYVTYDAGQKRPVQIKVVEADYTKAKNELGFNPDEYTTFENLIKIMVDADIARIKGGSL